MFKGRFCRCAGGSDGYAPQSSRIEQAVRLLVLALAVAASMVIAASMVGTWSVSALADGCGNERLREEAHSMGLPDCRAYELVGTPYKDGARLGGIGEIAPNGERTLLEGIGSFAGVKGSIGLSGSFYESVRTSLGWRVRGISLPESTYPRALRRDQSPSLERTLWDGRTVTQSADAANLFMREPDGLIVSVGPMLPPSAELAPPGGAQAPLAEAHGLVTYSGASSELSHVFFLLRPDEGKPGEVSNVWKGDKTLAHGGHGFSLYEYSGLGNSEPKLVGVRNKGRLRSDSEAEMITQCGTILGFGTEGSEGNVYNAISATGERVFFTASPGGCTNNEGEIGTGPPAREVYARINEEETIDISEPSHEECEECDISSPAEAKFEGASHDGSKVFFMSGQAGLLPGAAGMNLYEYDFNGPEHKKLIRISQVASEPSLEPKALGVVRVSEDGSRVYFVAEGKLVSNSNEYGAQAAEGADNLYVYDSVTGSTTFVARFSPEDSEDWQELNSHPAQATPDGEVLIFASNALLTPDDRSGSVVQLFEYDAGTGELVRVSVGQKAPGGYLCPITHAIEGFNCDGNTENGELAPKLQATEYVTQDNGNQQMRGLAISSNGTVAIFLSMDALAPQATNSLSSEEPCRNVYEYRWNKEGAPGDLGRGNVSLISDGQDIGKTIGGCGTSEEVVMDASGQDILIQSSQQLVSQDTNTQGDTYDAREGGGFPGVVSRPGCLEDGCQGSLSASPSLLEAGSASEVDGGNLATPVPQPMVEQKPRPLTRAQKLALALSACRRDSNRHKRAVCQSRARGRYGGKPKASKGSAAGGLHRTTRRVSK